MNYDVIVIGAGPAGIMAAITAARKGAKTALLEHNDRIGKKILSTGNGKCNMTNLRLDKTCYRSDSGTDYFQAFSQFGPQDTIKFFEDMGMITKNKNGYVYPNSEQAASVLDVLRFEVEAQHIDVICECKIISCTKERRFRIKSDKETYISDSLIVACGSKAYPKTGSDGSGYDIAKSFGHKIIRVIPALVQLRCQENFFREISGVRTDAQVSLIHDGNIVASDRGELQLTDYGISGIPVFQVSRYAADLIYSNKECYADIDLLPDMSINQVKELIHKAVSVRPERVLPEAMTGILNKKLLNMLIKNAGIPLNRPCGEVRKDKIDRLAQMVKKLRVTINQVNGFDNSQVCAGGVSLSQINTASMESTIINKLYFAGEILDVDGICGGYNLQWAFTSGYIAGMNSYK